MQSQKCYAFVWWQPVNVVTSSLKVSSRSEFYWSEDLDAYWRPSSTANWVINMDLETFFYWFWVSLGRPFWLRWQPAWGHSWDGQHLFSRRQTQYGKPTQQTQRCHRHRTRRDLWRSLYLYQSQMLEFRRRLAFCCHLSKVVLNLLFIRAWLLERSFDQLVIWLSFL